MLTLTFFKHETTKCTLLQLALKIYIYFDCHYRFLEWGQIHPCDRRVGTTHNLAKDWLWNITLMSYQHAWNYITREGIYFAYKDLGNSKQKIIPQKNIDGAVQVSCSCCIPQAAPGHTIAAFPLVINIGRTSQSGAWPPSLWLKTTFSFRFHRHDMWLFLGFANAR